MNTILSARLKKLTAGDLKSVFGPQIVVGENKDGFGNLHTSFNFTPEASPFGEKLVVKFIDPEIRYGNDGTISPEQISEAELFFRGLSMPWMVRQINAKFGLARFLLGTFWDHSKFDVPGSGAESGYRDILLRVTANEEHMSPRFISNLRKSAKFFDEITYDGEKCYIIVLDLSWKITNFGNIAKGVKSDIAEDDVNKAKSMLFPCHFWHVRSNNGVCLKRGWLIDRDGNELKPTISQALTCGYSFNRELICDEAMVEIWADLYNNDICLSCSMDDNGKVMLRYEQPYTSNTKLTMHQKRRMEMIRRQIIAQLKENAEQWAGMDEIDESEILWKNKC